MNIGDAAIKALKDWNDDPQLRKEFRSNFRAYSAFIRNCLEGRVSINGK